jgi:hypothetical protein
MLRFITGQVYESVEDGHQIIVTQTRSDGREGLLRLGGADSREEWFLWADFNQANKRRLVGALSG